MTISTEHPHLYVTRTAVLGYQEVVGGGFESIRRMLTTTLLSNPVPDPEHEGCYLLEAQDPLYPMATFRFRVYTLEDDKLLVVTKVEVAEPDA